MATTIEVLPKSAQLEFEAPPKFTTAERQIYFEYSESVRKIIQKLRSPENKVSFVLQYGYFKAKGRFFEPRQYRVNDLKYIYRTYGWDKPSNSLAEEDLNLMYGGANATRIRNEILKLEGWSRLDNKTEKELINHAYWQTEKQGSPEEILYALVCDCWQKRIVIPSYHVLSTIISQCYMDFEDAALSIIQKQLSAKNHQDLDALIKGRKKNTSLLALAKRVEESTRAQSMKQNAERLKAFTTYYFNNEALINELELTDQATDYLANWIVKAKTSQIRQIRTPNTIYLYLLAFIKSQFYKRQDIALTGFMKNVRASLNRAKKKARDYEQKTMAAKNKAIDVVKDSHRFLIQCMAEILQITEDPTLSDKRKLEIVRNRVIGIMDGHDEEFIGKMDFLDSCREKEKLDAVRIDALEAESLALQNKVADSVKLLVFDEVHSDPSIIKAIQYYQDKNGKIGHNPPIQFLTRTERKVIYQGAKLRTSLYKMFLFQHMFDRVKSGKLSLKYSYEYRALQCYLIDEEYWQQEKREILQSARLTEFEDVESYLEQLKEKLEATYEAVNKRVMAGHNGYMRPQPNGRYRVKTPAIDFEQSKYISTLLSSEGEIPVIQVLQQVERDCDIADRLLHHANRHTVKAVDKNTAIAGIMALGCNIGPRRMIGMSRGIAESVLLDCVNWRFSRKNLVKVNQSIIDAIESLDLPNIFKVEDDCIHSSSDGQKITVAVDSLLANYSFKYYGKEKGVSVYSFIDDKQSLFHPTVISATDREAIYVVDGLLHNTTSIRHIRIHSTDTHGYTEAVFGATHFINVAFAPRFRRIEDQVTYSFLSKQSYADKGYRVLPSRTIRRRLIEDNWDDILRFMATIKLGHTSASQLFKRLNSYSKGHPLYEALKEFGRIMKSQHILTYFDNLEFRQRIQKQLNRVEQSHRFSDAVFWDRSREFQVGAKVDQDKYNLCKTIIQNAIIYWNYLFLSDRLLNTGNPQDQVDMVDSIRKGSVLAWRHINFTGQYDFNKPWTKDYQFNLRKIKRLNIGHLLNRT